MADLDVESLCEVCASLLVLCPSNERPIDFVASWLPRHELLPWSIPKRASARPSGTAVRELP